MSDREVEQMTATERLERAGVEVEYPDAEAKKAQVLIRAILALEKLHEDPQATYEDMARAVLSLVSDEAEWWVSERLELQGECREANASEAAAIERARRAERTMRTVEETLAEVAECGAVLSPGRLAGLSAQLHNALRNSSPLSGFAAPQPKPDEGEGSVVSGTGSSVEQDTVQGLVEALEEAVAGSDELFAKNRARRLRLATVRARKALADFRAKNNTEEA